MSRYETVLDALTDHAERLGVFDIVMEGDPVGLPGDQMVLSWNADSGRPERTMSGLAATSILLTVIGRTFISNKVSPMAGLERKLLVVVDTVMESFHAQIQLGETDMHVDVLGQSGVDLRWQAGFVPVDDELYRVVDITIPVIITDMYAQEL